MSPKKTRAAVGIVAFAMIAGLVAGTAALAQVEQTHLRIDGMT